MIPISVAGGGLSGLALGLLLRHQQVPVTVVEAGNYPRHRVCGEFLSGRGQEVLGQLGLLPSCLAVGRLAQSAAFAHEYRQGPPLPLPQPALCLSRHRLDALLARELVNRGGELRTGEHLAWESNRPGMVNAVGRRVRRNHGRWRWFGIKAHAENVTLNADLELHVSPGAYVGLCRLPEDQVNVCGLFRRKPGDSVSSRDSRTDWLQGRPGSILHQRLAAARFDPESLCAVAGLDLRPRSASGQTGISLGDALTMIPPFTGNGMSLALETARWAAVNLASYSRGDSTWDEACQSYAGEVDQHCATRLRWATWLQGLMFLPLASTLLVPFTGIDWVWRRLFGLTRGL